MSRITLPDCTLMDAGDIFLTGVERTELIRHAGAYGVEGIRRFIEDRVDKSEGLMQRLRRYRKVLEEQARGIIASRRDKISRERRYIEQRVTQLTRVKRSHPPVDALVMDGLQKFLSSKILTDEETKVQYRDDRPVSRWERFRSFLRYILGVVIAYLTRIWRRLKRVFSRRKKVSSRGKVFLRGGIPSRFGRVFTLWRGRMNGVEMDHLLLARGFSRERIEAMKRIDPEGYREKVEISLGEVFMAHREEIEKEVQQLKKKYEKDQAEAKEREKIELEGLKQRHETLLKEEENLEKTLQQEIEKKAKERVEKDVIEEMVSAGYLKKLGKDIVVTPVLIERYAGLILIEEVRGLGSGVTPLVKAGGMPTGSYEKGRIRWHAELDRLDIVNTWINTRLHHPQKGILLEEDTAIVAKDIYTSTSHVVILLDKSGSMGENRRLDNAKRAVMALYKAVKLTDPRGEIDILTFDNDVKIMDLYSIWGCEPGSFTNTGEALRRAYEILRYSKSDRRIIYLITDGLPESYTDPDGRVVAGDLQRSMEYAEGCARLLKKLRNLRFVTILLEVSDPKYVSAAERISSILNGSIYSVEGIHLAREVLRDFLVREHVRMEA